MPPDISHMKKRKEIDMKSVYCLKFGQLIVSNCNKRQFDRNEELLLKNGVLLILFVKY